MKIRNNLDYDRACKVAGTHPVKTAPNLYLRVGAAKKKNAPDEPDRILGRRWLFRYTMSSKQRDMRITSRASRMRAQRPRCKVSMRIGFIQELLLPPWSRCPRGPRLVDLDAGGRNDRPPFRDVIPLQAAKDFRYLLAGRWNL
jgi:hypothetical protein